MQYKIYETIVGERIGFVVNVDYDEILHWNSSNNSFIILGKGNDLSMAIEGDDLRIVSKSQYKSAPYEYDDYNLQDLDNELYDNESLFSIVGNSKIIIMKTDLITEQLKLNGVVYTKDVFTAEKLLEHFCDRIDFNVEMIVHLNNLRLLNNMIKYHPGLIKFVKHVKINGQSALSVITNYNAGEVIRKSLNKRFNKTIEKNKKTDEELRVFVERCNREMVSEIMNEDSVENLMELYSELSNNNREKEVKRHINEMENDEAYMEMYNRIKNENEW